MHRLMAVKVTRGNAEHLRKHRGLRLGDQALDKRSCHGDIDAHARSDTAAAQARRQQHIVGRKGADVALDARNAAAHLAQALDLDARHEAHAERLGSAIIRERGAHGVGMSVRGTPRCANDLVGQVRIDLAHLLGSDHLHIEPQTLRHARQLTKRLQVLLGLAQAQVAALDVLDVSPQLVGQRGPNVLDGIHSKRQLATIAAALANATAIARARALAHIGLAVEHRDAATLLGQVVRRRASDHTGADNDDIAGDIGDICISPLHGYALPSSPLPSTLISIGRMGAREVSGSKSATAGVPASSVAIMRRTSLVQLCPWHSPMP